MFLRKDTSVRELVHTALIICFLSGLLLLILGLGFSGILLKIMNTKEELIDGARLYLKVCFLGMSALAVYNFGNAVLSAMGDTKRPLYFRCICCMPFRGQFCGCGNNIFCRSILENFKKILIIFVKVRKNN